MSSFNDLLTRVDNLKSKASPTNELQSPLTKKSPLEQHDLRSIFRASDEIWKRKQLRSDFQWKPRDGLTGSLPKSPFRNEHAIDSTTSLDQSTSGAFDDYSKRSTGKLKTYSEGDQIFSESDARLPDIIDSYIKRSAERARIEAERAFINQHILEQSQTIKSKTDKQLGAVKSDPAGGVIAEAQPDEVVIDTLAKHVSKLLAKTSSVSIEKSVRDALDEIGEVDAKKLWRKVFSLCELKRSADSGNVAEFRNTEQWKHYVIDKATTLLQQTFKDHMENVIQNNLQIAQRGGVPGTKSLIDAYLNVRLSSQFQYQDGIRENGKHPIWPFLFLCLRIGDFKLASQVATNLQNLSNCSILIKILTSFNESTLVDGDKRFQLNAEWKHVMSTCHDPYKRAVYAMILGHECPEVNNNIENWLWSRLMNCKLDPVNGIGHFYKLQSTICVDYGEEYFVGGATGNYMVYFTVLWLTGQIERAIDLLFRSDQRYHAVHIAILAYQQKLLNTSLNASDPILWYDPKDPIYCRLNFSRLILLYVKNFELTNLDYTLSYCFFLRNIDFERDHHGLEGGNIFEACVSRLCFISDKVDQILGRMSETGDRIHGLIDRFPAEIDPHKIIARVAKDFDFSGDSLTACRLYILSGHPNEALKICSKQLATYLSIAREKGGEHLNELEETIRLGKWLESRYQQRPENPEFQEAYLAELSTLIKLSTFYAAAANDPIEAFSIVKSINLLPLSNEELSIRVSSFANLPEQVRSVLPDVVMLTMETLFKLFKESTSQQKRVYYRSCSNSLLMYVAQINLRFPVQINSKLLQLQSQLN